MKIFLSIFLLLISVLSAQANEEITKHLSGVSVYDITGDGNNIWIATNGSGIYRYNLKEKKWRNFSTSDGSLSLDFFHAVDANENFVWAGSTDGLFIYDKKRNNWSKRKFSKGGQLGNWIRSVKYDRSENIVWIGRFMYLTKYEINNRRFIDYDLTINRDEKTNTIKTIAIDGDSLVWFGTENGLHKYDKYRDIAEPGALTFYDNRLNYFKGQGSAVSISKILFEQNFVWIGCDEFITRTNPEYNVGGLYKYDRRNQWIRFDNSSGLRGNGIFDIEITGNHIWVSLYQFSINTKEPYGRGIALIDRQTETVRTLNHPSLPETVHALYFDGVNMWLGAEDGLVQINFYNSFISDFSKKQD